MSVEKRTRGEISEDRRDVDGREALSTPVVRVAGTSPLGVSRELATAYVMVVVSMAIVAKSSSL